MSRTTAIILLALGVGSIAGGLFFLFIAIAAPFWLLVSLPLFAIGIGLAIWSALALAKRRELDPENVGDRITKLAKGAQGEITLSEVVAKLDVPDEAAIGALNILERRDICYRERRGERQVYVFPGLKPTLKRRKCPYCGAEFSVKKAVYRCPHCGGDLTLQEEQA